MKILKIVIFTAATLYCSVNIKASVYLNVPIENLIKASDLIIKGKVDKKHSQSENVLVAVQVKKGNEITTHKVDARIPMTTYTIIVDEIIKGKYLEKKLDVKMQGGCGDDGLCLDDSSNYNYQVENEVVMFLSFDQDNKNYVSSEGGLTAFKLSKSNEIYREGEFAYLRENSVLLTKQTNAVILTLEELKLKVVEILEDE